MPSQKALAALHLTLGNELTAVKLAHAAARKAKGPKLSVDQLRQLERADAHLDAAWTAIQNFLLSEGLPLDLPPRAQRPHPSRKK